MRGVIANHPAEHRRGLLGSAKGELALAPDHEHLGGVLEAVRLIQGPQHVGGLAVLTQPIEADAQPVAGQRRLFMIRVALQELAVLGRGQVVHAAVEQPVAGEVVAQGRGVGDGLLAE